MNWFIGEIVKLEDEIELLKSANADVKRIADERDEYREIVKAVAHIGVDFGFGVYELNQGHIETARKLIEKSGGAL
jgi:hypothetical protein